MAQATFDNATTYGDMKMKEKIGPMLNLDPSEPWEIVSETETGLVMVHHGANADLQLYSSLRGVGVDTNTGNVVCYSFPHASRFVSPFLSATDGKIFLSEEVVLNPDNLKIKVGFEGPLIHVFKHGGKVYHSTRKRFDPSKSRWGNSKTFEQIYQELNGPSDEVLFDPSKNYSPYVHTFIMVHPHMLVCTKADVGTGYLVYLGPKKMYSVEKNCPYPVEEVDGVLRVPDTSSEVEVGKIYSPSVLTLEEANKHLLFGFSQGFEGYEYLDPRTLPGEFVIIEDTETGSMYRIESPSYYWRSCMRNNNPNLLHRFYELLDFAYLKNTQEDEKKYFENFPLLTIYEMSSLKEAVEKTPIKIWPQDLEKVQAIPNTRDSKLYNIWQCFLASVPLCRQKEVVGFYEHLVNRRNEVISWLSGLSVKSDLNLELFSRRIQDILTKTRSFAMSKVRTGDNKDQKTGKYKTADMITKENIRNFMNKEMGSSLYRIIREMDRYNSPAVAQK